MSNWNNNDGVKIDTWDPKSIKGSVGDESQNRSPVYQENSVNSNISQNQMMQKNVARFPSQSQGVQGNDASWMKPLYGQGSTGRYPTQSQGIAGRHTTQDAVNIAASNITRDLNNPLNYHTRDLNNDPRYLIQDQNNDLRYPLQQNQSNAVRQPPQIQGNTTRHHFQTHGGAAMYPSPVQDNAAKYSAQMQGNSARNSAQIQGNSARNSAQIQGNVPGYPPINQNNTARYSAEMQGNASGYPPMNQGQLGRADMYLCSQGQQCNTTRSYDTNSGSTSNSLHNIYKGPPPPLPPKQSNETKNDPHTLYQNDPWGNNAKWSDLSNMPKADNYSMHFQSHAERSSRCTFHNSTESASLSASNIGPATKEDDFASLFNHQNNYGYEKELYPSHSSQSKQIFQGDICSNPLIDTIDDFATAHEQKNWVQNMEQYTKKISQLDTRKPKTISKASLAQVSHDLRVAGEHFESVDSLSKFKEMNLGLPPSSTGENEEMAKIVQNSKLSVNATIFVPKSSKIPYTPASQKPTEILSKCINVICSVPAQYEIEESKLLKALHSCPSSKTDIKDLASLLFETFLTTHSDFIFLGAQLCDTLSRKASNLVGFRDCIFGLAQVKFEAVDHLIASQIEMNLVKVRNFALFMAELYMMMKVVNKHGELTTFHVLGRGVIDVVEKLLNTVSDENMKCAINILKLSMHSLQSNLSNDDKSQAKLNGALDKLVKISKGDTLSGYSTVLNHFIKTRINADPLPLSSQLVTNTPAPTKLLSLGPVYYTPEGTPYTRSDLMEQETDFNEDFQYDIYNAELDEQFEDDYDADLQKFLDANNS